MIFLVNEKHGKKIAYSPMEAESDKKSGWKQVTKDEFYGPVIQVPVTEPKRRGKNAVRT